MAHKKKAKRGRPRMRNAATAAVARIPRRPIASTAAHEGEPSNTDSRAWQVAKVLGGAAVSAVGCSFIARQEWLPPKALTAGVAAVGAALYAGGQNDTLRMVGAGAAASAGGMFTYLMIDDAVHTKSASQPQVASNPPPAKRQADGLPPGALEAAYERARRRMALADHG